MENIMSKYSITKPYQECHVEYKCSSEFCNELNHFRIRSWDMIFYYNKNKKLQDSKKITAELDRIIYQHILLKSTFNREFNFDENNLNNINEINKNNLESLITIFEDPEFQYLNKNNIKEQPLVYEFLKSAKSVFCMKDNYKLNKFFKKLEI